MSAMVGKQIALIQVPNQRAYRSAAAAQYLGIDEDTLHKYTAEGKLHPKNMNGRRAYLLEDLNKFLDELPLWEKIPAAQHLRQHHQKKEKQHV